MDTVPEMNGKSEGYRGIWYYNQETKDEYVYKYSGGLGTYCAKHIPLAVYSQKANKTFFSYGGVKEETKELLEMVGCYDHKKGTVCRPTILMNKETEDAHDNVVISLDPKGFVWAFASAHGQARPAYIFRSKKPHSTDQFDLILKTEFSYPQPWYMKEKGFLFLHTRYGSFESAGNKQGRKLCWMVSRDGVKWSERQYLSAVPIGHYQVSLPFETKVGTAFNMHPHPNGLNWRTNLYYVETKDMGKTWRTVEGTPIQPPLEEIKNETLIRDYQSEGLLAYMKDINYDEKGRPIILHVTSKGWEPGPEKGPRTWTIAYWTGKKWEFRKITESDNNYDTGCIHVESDGTWRVIGPTETGPQPFSPGGEMAVWISNDKGKTWKKEHQITSDSEYNHTYARRPVNAHPDFYALWADGHGRKYSPSRIYFCDKTGKKAYRLPYTMKENEEKPEPL